MKNVKISEEFFLKLYDYFFLSRNNEFYSIEEKNDLETSIKRELEDKMNKLIRHNRYPVGSANDSNTAL